MKKYIAFAFSLFLLPIYSMGQSFDYGNSWYANDADQTYIKFVVKENGIYRVSAQDLSNAGYDISGINPDFLRLIYRGKEVPIYVSKLGGAFGYLEFYGEHNDGAIDSIMYRDPVTGLHRPNLQPNDNFSIFTEESAYYLTWDNATFGSRYFSNFDPTYSLYTPEPYFRYESRLEYEPESASSEYIRGGGGQFDSFFTLNSDYVTGEGYMSKESFGFSDPVTVTVPTPNPANTGNPHEVKTRVFGRSNSPHFLRVLMDGDQSDPVVDTTINVSSVYVRTYTREYSKVITDNTDLTFEALRSPVDNNNLCWSSITYDRLTQFDGDSSVWIKDFSKGTKAYFRMDNVGGQDSVWVYDLTNKFRNIGVMDQNSGRVIVQNFGGNRDLFFTTDNGIRKPEIQDAKLNKLFDPNGGAEFVIIAHRDLSASAEAYRLYRDTATVTPLSARVVYTDEIYDEYGYGSITPWAIKRFCKNALDTWTVKPKYFLLWGKGYNRTRRVTNVPFVPTYGYPATDYEFIAHFQQNSTQVKPEASIGRVNLFDNDEGFDYLAKVDEHEHTPWQSWMKEGVFLGGGGTEGEQNAISGTFNYMIDVFSDDPFGGEAHYFQKRSSSVLLDPSTASYHDQISGGVSIVHFFGHSTSNIQDISIREAQEYTNISRYPLMIAMGCYGGDFTVGGSSFGERWLVAEKRGCIGYLANSSAGYLNPLRDYSRIFYPKIYNSMLGMPIGDILRETLTSYTDSLIGIQYRNHGRQMNLQGDPAVVVYFPERPDLAIEESGIYFTPENFTAQDDSFKINVIVENLGLVTKDSFRMTIRQRLPDGNFFYHPDTDYPMVRYKDTLTVTLNNPVGNELTGQNFFEVFVDAEGLITEYREDNNRVTINRVVPGNIPAILSPLEFAIVGEAQVALQASAFFMTRDEDVGYVFEIDTTDFFNSPLKASSGVLQGSATFASWEVPFTLQDSTVYFWRVRLADVSPRVWGQSSFKYIANRSGWAQAKLPQFVKNEAQSVEVDKIQRQWRFGNFGVEYEAFTRNTTNQSFVYSINGSLEVDLALNNVSSNGVAWVIIDQFTLQPTFVQQNFGRVGFAASPSNLYQLKDAIGNMTQGDYIIVSSHFNPRVHLWPDDVFNSLSSIGASQNIKLLQDGDPFILFGRKGYPNSAVEVYTPNSDDKLLINNVLLANSAQGSITSPR
ncbi:MAG: C25 family cysteine peptidase, partial [Bacteroidota bacterium]